MLSTDAQYDLACACNTSKDQARKRSPAGNWIYPVTLPNGGRSVLFKTLMSNACNSDCKYCPLREQQDPRRCTLTPEETVEVFLDYYQRGQVFGLFLSSSLMRSADATMQRINSVARILRRRHRFTGYIHLKVIPGASDAAVEEAVSLANAVSLNIETPGQANMLSLSTKKDYIRDIINPIKLISRLTAKGTKYQQVKQSTQFIVGAAQEADTEIVKYMWGLYDRLKLQRIYFSTYQKGLGDPSMPGERAMHRPEDVFQREHRLYQVDFLFRQYGFTESDIVFGEQGGLSLTMDPKEAWAVNHPEQFPVPVNHAPKWKLLRVPGLGPVTVRRILQERRKARITSVGGIGRVGKRLRRAEKYLTF